MPLEDLPFSSEDELLSHLTDDMGLDSDKAERVAEIVVDEAQSDEGNPKQLLESIKNGAKSIMAELGVEMVSYVGNPSQDSFFTMMKTGDSDMIKKETSIYKEPEEDWDTVYGPVMRPNDIDKDGDIAPASHIKKTAHKFMEEGRVNQFDQDHDLNTGKGVLVESWILKEDKEYERPNGETEVLKEGTWMIGNKPSPEVKERIENGEITGWSIFGQADKVELKNEPAWKNFNNETVVNTSKDDTMSENPDTDETQTDQELSLKDVHSEITEFKEAFNEFKESPEPSTVKSMEELKNHLKSEETNNVVELGKDFELETTEKEPEMENLGDLMDFLEDSLNEDNFSMLMDAVRGESEEEQVEEESDMDEDEEEDEEKQEEETEKSQNPKEKHKQVDTKIEKQSRSTVSFQDRVKG